MNDPGLSSPAVIESPGAAPWREGPYARLAPALASFRHRNYRFWFAGQAASLVGTWMQSTAQGFLVFQLTHSPAFLGLVSFAGGAPMWLLVPFGGVLSDRMRRRDLLLITQSGMMLLALILSLLTFLRLVEPWHIVVLAVCLESVTHFLGCATIKAWNEKLIRVM